MVNPLAARPQSKLRIDKVENVSVPPNTERTLCNRTGPGVVGRTTSSKDIELLVLRHVWGARSRTWTADQR